MTARVRILLGVLAGVMALGAAFFLLRGGPSSSAAAPHVIKPLHPVARKSRAARPNRVAKHAVAKPTAVRKAEAAKAKAKAKARKRVAAVVDGLPASLAAALRHHDVVVVSLYAPRSAVSEMARDEARDGAAGARVGFVAVSVANEAQARALTDLVAGEAEAVNRLLDEPAVFVFRQPRVLYVRLNGFVDRDTVAQAAQNAETGIPSNQ
jgi:hypothetical protein